MHKIEGTNKIIEIDNSDLILYYHYLLLLIFYIFFYISTVLGMDAPPAGSTGGGT